MLTQPAAVLVAPDGRWIERWSGEFVEDEVLAAIDRDAQTAGAPGP